MECRFLNRAWNLISWSNIQISERVWVHGFCQHVQHSWCMTRATRLKCVLHLWCMRDVMKSFKGFQHYVTFICLAKWKFSLEKLFSLVFEFRNRRDGFSQRRSWIQRRHRCCERRTAKLLSTHCQIRKCCCWTKTKSQARTAQSCWGGKSNLIVFM